MILTVDAVEESDVRHDGLRRHLYQQAFPDWKLDDPADRRWSCT
jgi:hypothetical protein